MIWQFGVTGTPGRRASKIERTAQRGSSAQRQYAHRGLEQSTNHRSDARRGRGLDLLKRVELPRDADRQAGGSTLIADSGNNRILEVAFGGATLWQYSTGGQCYDADRLSSGNTLISVGASIIEVNPAGVAAWSYPVSVTEEEVWITNPASGVALYCHVHRPSDFDPGLRYPGLALIPGGSGSGTVFDINERAQAYADLGFVVMHFDPDGRGQSTNGGTYTTEDYCGYIQQDGLRAVLMHLISLPEVDPTNVGALTNSYGITMGAGTLGRYPNSPPVKFMVDWEGPSDRTDTAQPNGHVPHDAGDDEWWYEREPINFIDDFPGYYLRAQSEIDHAQPDNEHAILLNNLATHTMYGGGGLASGRASTASQAQRGISPTRLTARKRHPNGWRNRRTRRR